MQAIEVVREEYSGHIIYGCTCGHIELYSRGEIIIYYHLSRVGILDCTLVILFYLQLCQQKKEPELLENQRFLVK